MNKVQRTFTHWIKVVLLLLCCVILSLFCGYSHGKKSVETDLKELATNVYGGRYYVELSFIGVDGIRNSIDLSCSGFRFPMRNSDGKGYIKTSMPFIERKEFPYDISCFALIDEKSSSGFDFTFIDCPHPENIFVQCWPKEQQGTVGTFTNGEPVDFKSTTQPMRYHVSEFKPGYIYSIYASWGPYYAEYACLASDKPEDRVYWKLEG